MPPSKPDPDEVRIRVSLDVDSMYRRAVVSCIQEIGEAANRVSEPARVSLPSVPWRDIVLMRNQIVHVYFNVEPDIVWQVLTQDLEPLLAALQAWLDGRANP